jgi:hyperosmotically inducible protein
VKVAPLARERRSPPNNQQGDEHPPKADDPKVETEVKQALANYGPLRSMKITVSVKDGVATLQGAAKTDEHALAAALLARSVDGVRAVRNELTVKR